MYIGHWIYDENSASPLLYVNLPLFYQNYDMTVTKISVQGVSDYSGNIEALKYKNAVLLKHPSVTGTTHIGKLGIAVITFKKLS